MFLGAQPEEKEPRTQVVELGEVFLFFVFVTIFSDRFGVCILV